MVRCLVRLGPIALCPTILLLCSAAFAEEAMSTPNLVPNGDFQHGELGAVPEGWTVVAARPSLSPRFTLAHQEERTVLLATGNGNPDCVGYLATKVPIALGKTYVLRAVFRMSPGIDPSQNALFQCYGPGASSGLHEFRRLPDGWVEAKARITYTGEGPGEAEARVLFRLSAAGQLWVRELSLTESEPEAPRWVRVACTSGKTDLTSCEAILDAAGQAGADLVLLPEYMQGDRIEEPLEGPSYQLMSAKARQYGMYVAGGIVRAVPASEQHADLVYNTAVLLDRRGDLLGQYDKVHPYSPELNEQGISVGRQVPVFRTDFGTVGIMICYDSWFTDVAELLALKGAEIILFPNAGYYRALIHARAADNRVRIVCSSWNSGYGVWDTVGRDLTDPNGDRSHGDPPGVTYRDLVETKVGDVGLLMVSLDLNCSPSPHYNGGSMFEAPGGRRNRREQALFLEEQIRAERERWWTD